jgi:hypothetical protein
MVAKLDAKRSVSVGLVGGAWPSAPLHADIKPTAQMPTARMLKKRWPIATSWSAGQLASGIVNRVADTGVSSAAADIAAHGEIDVMVGRAFDFLQKRDRTHHLAGLAVPTLWDIAGDPSFLYCGSLSPGYSFNGRDLAIAEC